MKLKRLSSIVPTLFIAALIAVVCGGCATPAEKEFAAADVRVISMYVDRVQPAVEAYADATGDEQLRIDTRALAAEMVKNAAARIERLKTDSQAIETARAALDVATAALDAFEATGSRQQGAGSGQQESQPAGDGGAQ
jgi:outer membrane murein-binding lipoprotein Lpp